MKKIALIIAIFSILAVNVNANAYARVIGEVAKALGIEMSIDIFLDETGKVVKLVLSDTPENRKKLKDSNISKEDMCSELHMNPLKIKNRKSSN